MTDHRRGVGQRSESVAADYLQQAGLRLVAANASARLGELDLIMLDHDRTSEVLVFVEVRYRKYRQFGGAAASVDHSKQRRLIRTAQLFLATHPDYRDLPCRFDVIAASGNPNAPDLDWIRDAFQVDVD